MTKRDAAQSDYSADKPPGTKQTREAKEVQKHEEVISEPTCISIQLFRQTGKIALSSLPLSLCKFGFLQLVVNLGAIVRKLSFLFGKF